jgi:hypothetical protein
MQLSGVPCAFGVLRVDPGSLTLLPVPHKTCALTNSNRMFAKRFDDLNATGELR